MSLLFNCKPRLLAIAAIMLFGVLPTGCGGSHGQAVTHDLTPGPSPDDGQLGIGIKRDSSRRIVFTASPDGSGNDEIYTAQPDGTDLLRITNTTAADREPDWSPDRTRIVFTRTRDRGELVNALGLNIPQRADIWIMNADGTGQRKLFSADPVTVSFMGNTMTPNRYAAYPRFSPDGTSIAAAVYKETPDSNQNTSSLYLINVATGENRQISSTGGALSWSPDSQKIVFASRDASTPRFLLYIIPNMAQIRSSPTMMATPTSITTPPTNYSSDALGPFVNYGSDSTPSWSPDGASVVFSRNSFGFTDPNDPNNRTFQGGLFKISPDGSSLQHLTTQLDAAPSFSLDGSRILFTRFVGEVVPNLPVQFGSLYTVGISGQNEIRLTTNLPAGAGNWGGQ